MRVFLRPSVDWVKTQSPFSPFSACRQAYILCLGWNTCCWKPRMEKLAEKNCSWTWAMSSTFLIPHSTMSRGQRTCLRVMPWLYVWNKIILNNFKPITVFYFTCNHNFWHSGTLVVNKTLKLFKNYFSVSFHLYIITSEIILRLFQPLKLFQNYFSDIEHVGKYSWAAISLWDYFEIIISKIISVGRSTKPEIILK